MGEEILHGLKAALLCAACGRSLESDPFESLGGIWSVCLLADHTDYWRGKAEQALQENRTLQELLGHALERIRRLT